MQLETGARSARGGLVTLVATIVALLAPSSAMAIQAIPVTTNQDGAVPGKTTLRQAIDQANAASGAVEITLDAHGTYTLTQCGPTTDTSNRSGNLSYFGSAQLTIEANGNTLRQTCPGDRVLLLDSSSLVNVNDLTVSGGDAAGQPGGGIWSQGTGELDLKNDVFSNNHSDAAGGGVAESSGKLVVTGSTFVTNSGTELAGAIASIGPMELIKSTVSGNTGGTAPGSPAPVGGVAASAGLLMIYSTVQDNTAENINIEQGGLESYASVVGFSHPTGQSFPTCGVGGGTKSLGYNFSADPSCGFGGAPGDRAHGDPKMQPATTASGAFEAVPGKASPLINAIPKSQCAPSSIVALAPVYAGLSFDQFGTRRPQGSGCDIGAVEMPSPTGQVRHQPRKIHAGQQAKFTSSGAKEAGGRIVKYVWRWGDRSAPGHGRSAAHVFRRPGHYRVKLILVGSNGQQTTIVTRVTVSR